MSKDRKTEALRYNDGKPELSQLFYFGKGLEALAAHCSAGREKYPDVDNVPNWMLGAKPDEEYLDSATRHLAAMVRGETHDPELGTLHAAAVAWNMLALITLNYDDATVSKEDAPPMSYLDVFWDHYGGDRINPADWFRLGARERSLARAAGFREEIDGSATRAR